MNTERTSHHPVQPEVLNFLLDNSHQIPNGMIVDCLKLARLNPDPRERLAPAFLGQHLGTKSNVEVSRRLGRLHRSGLINYERGTQANRGYRILRVGPKQW